MTLHFGVTPQKEALLRARMEACGLREADLAESFTSSGGPGGQNVNRTATCVRLRHRPSGLEAKAQSERSQSLNRYRARQRLCELIEAQALGQAAPDALRRAKIAKQKSRRARRRARPIDQ